MRRLLGLMLVLLLLPVYATSQNRQPGLDDPTWIARVFQLRYLDASSLQALLYPFGVVYQYQSNLNAVSVRAPASVMPAVEEVIKRLDVPAYSAKTVDITCHLILGSPQANANEVIPAALRPVVEQLRAVLNYKSYRVLDTIIGRSAVGRKVSLSGAGSKLSDNEPWPSEYSLSLTAGVTGNEQERMIRLDQVTFAGFMVASQGLGLTPGEPISRIPVNMSTTLDLKQGQQIVVGKSTVRDHALILVISAKVID